MSASPLAPAWLRVPVDANALPACVWPRSAARDAHGELTLAGVPVSALRERFGTPLYVVDEADARSRAEETVAAFRRELARVGSGASVYYAGKAFLCTTVARWMDEAGLGIDVASGGELAVALAAGTDPARLGLHGNNKSDRELERAVAAGVGTIVLDSIPEVDRVAAVAARAGRLQRVRLRVTTGVHAHTHEFLATAREDQKFGVPLADVGAAAARIRACASLSFAGLHSHIGSQIFEPDGFAEAARRLLAVHARLLEDGPVPELNLGGGFGIAYTDADRALPVPEIARALADIVQAECVRLRVPVPHVAVEPGRAIIGPSTVTLYEAGTVKEVEVTVPSADAEAAPEPATAVRTYVSVDGGMSDNIRPALYGADYSVRIAGRTSEAAPVLVRVVGKHCESGDVVVHADYLPGDVRRGDVLAVPATGAYCWSLASNYNYLGRPPVVAVRDGGARVIVRGETEEDLLARDAGVPERDARGSR